jgi:hypothetical protein
MVPPTLRTLQSEEILAVGCNRNVLGALRTDSPKYKHCVAIDVNEEGRYT